MAALETLPTEIIIEIAEYIYDAEERRLPIIGGSAAWRMPPTIYEYSKDDETSKGNAPFVEEVLPYSNGLFPDAEERQHIPALLVRGTCHFGSLKALRCVNRFFARICEPLLYRELDLTLQAVYHRWETLSLISGAMKWDYAQSMAINLKQPTSTVNISDGSSEEYGLYISKFRNLRRLSLYYSRRSIPSAEMRAAVIRLLEAGNLRYLGIYSNFLIEHLDNRSRIVNLGIAGLLDAICESPTATKNLRALDVVVESIPSDTFDLVRTRLVSLESLTIRRTLEPPAIEYRLWDPPQQSKWGIYPNLTRLNLAHFDAGHAPHIPHLVGHFTALRELTVSACGIYSDRGERRASGWSNLRDALCNVHPPLDWLWMEHMIDWEIYELGIIPTKTLIVTTVAKQHLLTNLRQDAEIFPHLEILRLAPPSPNTLSVREDAVVFGNDLEDEEMPSVKDICDTRGVKIRRDAVANFTCNCCNRETGWY